MSIRQMTLVWEHEFTHSEQSIMMALADHAHDDGTEIRPSAARIAWKTGYEERQVHRILKTLRDDLRVLVLVKEGGGRGKPNVYRFDWTKAVKKSEFTTKKRVTSETVKGDISDVNTDIAMSPEPSSIEPSENHPTPVGAETSSATPKADEFVSYLAEELDGADVPYTGGWRGRHGKQFKECIGKDVPTETLYKTCDRIIERWTGEKHHKLTVEHAVGDVLNGGGPRRLESGQAINGKAAEDRRKEGYEWLFGETG